MSGRVWSLSSLMHCSVLLAVLYGVAAAGPATAPSSTQPSPQWAPSPLVNLPPNVASVTIPLKRSGDYLCAFVRIDGKEAGWFIIDTGATCTIIDRSVVKQIGLESDSGVEISAPSKGIHGGIVKYRDLEVGPIAMHRGIVGVTDLTLFNTNLPLAGVLGDDLLRELPVMIDYRSATLTLYRRKEFKPPASESFSLMMDRDTPVVDALIEGWSMPIMIDTGADSAFEMEGTVEDLYHISMVGRHSLFTAVADEAGVTYELEGSFGPVKVFGREFQNVRITCPADHQHRASTNAGTVGAVLLQDARLTLDYAAKTGWLDWSRHAQSTDELLHELGDPKSKDLAGVTPLMRAAQLGWEDAAAELLKRGADVNAKSAADLTALFYAARSHHPAIVKLLLSAGADPNMTTAWGNMSALYAAAAAGDAQSVNLLLAAHAKVDMAKTDGETALIAAAGADYQDVVRLLLDAGADMNATTKNKRTAVSAAAGLASPQMVSLLLKRGAKVNGVPGVADIPLWAAASMTNLATVKLLLQSGADVNQQDPHGRTPLMMAAIRGDESVVLALLEAGADPTIRSVESKTAADFTNYPFARLALINAADTRAPKSGR